MERAMVVAREQWDTVGVKKTRIYTLLPLSSTVTLSFMSISSLRCTYPCTKKRNEGDNLLNNIEFFQRIRVLGVFLQ
jgi:hypothetical protein